jgi:hypothetical protein
MLTQIAIAFSAPLRVNSVTTPSAKCTPKLLASQRRQEFQRSATGQLKTGVDTAVRWPHNKCVDNITVELRGSFIDPGVGIPAIRETDSAEFSHNGLGARSDAGVVGLPELLPS